MRDTNEMKMEFDSCSENEGFARVAAAAFLTQLNPTVEEVSDVKTAVSEAVTNAIIHGYEGKVCGADGLVHKIEMTCRIKKKQFILTVKDAGVGIADIARAREPMYTTKPELDRSGMGFAFMEAFMDDVAVVSAPGEGTAVTMTKTIGKGREAWTTQSL